MASKESRKKKEEITQIFNEVHQIAYGGASPIMRSALDQYKARFEELMQRQTKAKG